MSAARSWRPLQSSWRWCLLAAAPREPMLPAPWTISTAALPTATKVRGGAAERRWEGTGVQRLVWMGGCAGHAGYTHTAVVCATVAVVPRSSLHGLLPPLSSIGNHPNAHAPSPWTENSILHILCALCCGRQCLAWRRLPLWLVAVPRPCAQCNRSQCPSLLACSQPYPA